MSVNRKGVKFDVQRAKRGIIIIVLLAVLEGIFTFFLYLSLAGRIFDSRPVESAAGVPQLLSFQGRLTDSSGNPLGGTATVYCFRYSIYDAVSSGSKLWPSGTPTDSTTTVVDGIFNDQIGRMDSLTYDFFSTSTLYLDVQVNTVTSTCSGSWEALAPRQQILASGFSLTSESIYGDALRTPTSTKVQLGTGAGVGSGQTLLSLDVRNTAETIGASCSDNGALWYNSNNTKALLCENGVIQQISNPTSTITGVKEQSTSTAISSGTVNFSGSANITISQTGNTLQFSVDAAGGGATLSHWPPFPVGLATSSNNTGTTAAGTNITASFHVAPLQLHQALSFSRINVVGSFATVAGTGSISLAQMLGIYTLNGGTALSLSTSYMFRDEISQNSVTAQSHRFYWGTNSGANSSSSGGNISASYTGLRVLPLYVSAGGASLSAGQYYVVYAQTNRSTSSNIMPAASLMYISESQSTLGGQLGSASTLAPFPLIGQFSSTTTAGNFTTPFMPSSVNTTVITNTGGSSQWKWPYVMFVGK